MPHRKQRYNAGCAGGCGALPFIFAFGMVMLLETANILSSAQRPLLKVVEIVVPLVVLVVIGLVLRVLRSVTYQNGVLRIPGGRFRMGVPLADISSIGLVYMGWHYSRSHRHAGWFGLIYINDNTTYILLPAINSIRSVMNYQDIPGMRAGQVITRLVRDLSEARATAHLPPLNQAIPRSYPMVHNAPHAIWLPLPEGASSPAHLEVEGIPPTWMRILAPATEGVFLASLLGLLIAAGIGKAIAVEADVAFLIISLIVAVILQQVSQRLGG